jgi:hypothetical protein
VFSPQDVNGGPGSGVADPSSGGRSSVLAGGKRSSSPSASACSSLPTRRRGGDALRRTGGVPFARHGVHGGCPDISRVAVCPCRPSDTTLWTQLRRAHLGVPLAALMVVMTAQSQIRASTRSRTVQPRAPVRRTRAIRRTGTTAALLSTGRPRRRTRQAEPGVSVRPLAALVGDCTTPRRTRGRRPHRTRQNASHRSAGRPRCTAAAPSSRPILSAAIRPQRSGPGRRERRSDRRSSCRVATHPVSLLPEAPSPGRFFARDRSAARRPGSPAGTG